MKNIILLFAVLCVTACSNSNSSSQNSEVPLAGYTNVDTEEFKKLMGNDNIVVLDVRTPAETARGTISGAKQLDYKNKDFSAKLDDLDKNKTYLVYCHAGGRSSNTCKMMKEKGFKHLYNLDGGYAAWE